MSQGPPTSEHPSASASGGLWRDAVWTLLGEGLYAAGNNAATMMGHTYPGPGATLGPAAVFGYLAGRHLAGVGS